MSGNIFPIPQVPLNSNLNTSVYRFNNDVDSLEGGEMPGNILSIPQVPLNSSSNTNDPLLPNGYSADVEKIVKLLIGKSLYPDPEVFVRELIQNSVDACNRAKEINSVYIPQIKININSSENYFEIYDEGDGMNKKILREHFSVIGKSISQDFIDSINHSRLISQFGIGFISTFIVAQKIIISTKSREDGLIYFEIDDVFKGFNYNLPSKDKSNFSNTGTCIKVYLKSTFSSANLLGKILTYCRHVANLQIYYNGNIVERNESWNTENGAFFIERKKSKYEYKLCISGEVSKTLIASNCGFLLSNFPQEITPFLFPTIIGGEILFNAGAIDLNLSRSNIMSTEKANDVKYEISLSLRELFNKVIENANFSQISQNILLQTVITHLQCYLVHYDGLIANIEKSYSTFYSKSELINLCSKYTFFSYNGKLRSIEEILFFLEEKNERVIYHSNENQEDFINVTKKYLLGKGSFLFNNPRQTVQFRELSLNFNFEQLMGIIIKGKNFQLANINEIANTEINNMTITRNSIDYRINSSLIEIESIFSIKIEIGRFGNDYRQVFFYNNVNYINYNHLSFQDILLNINKYDDETLKIYLCGIIGVPFQHMKAYSGTNNLN